MKKWIAPLCLLLLLGGCSSKFAYNNFDWLVYWYVDDYVELNDAQESVFDRHLAKWMAWHRHQELARYADQLALLKQDVADKNLSEDRVLFHLQQATSHWDRVRRELSPDLAQMAALLSDEQVIALFAALEKENQEEEDELNEYLSMTDDEKAADRLSRIIDGMEDRIGRLTGVQREIVERYSPLFLSTRAQWIDYRRAIQQSARRLFADRHNNPAFIAELTALMNDPDSYRSDLYRSQRDENQQVYARMAAEIAATLTDKQREKLIKELSSLLEDIQDLKNDA
ncbi:DUF6279 family lipoprotein [Alteromonas sp. CYL-A6]|uniref:DUF6279 family lipoprotein n=1 Tax=Alteromonas nitratireducens TaxID=3390813 RepID=UPI0034B6F377